MKSIFSLYFMSFQCFICIDLKILCFIWKWISSVLLLLCFILEFQIVLKGFFLFFSHLLDIVENHDQMRATDIKWGVLVAQLVWAKEKEVGGLGLNPYEGEKFNLKLITNICHFKKKLWYCGLDRIEPWCHDCC